MELTTFRFSNNTQADFSQTLKQRVNDYFKSNNLNRHGGSKIIWKTIVMIMLLLVPYLLMVGGYAPNLWVFFLLWTLMGIGTAGLGLNVMHDAIHGAYSKNSKINRVMGLVLNFIGGHSEIWRLQHNVLHHSFTNIDGGDEDLLVTPLLRFSPNQRLMRIHRFQHVYAWFLYGLMTLSKLAFNDIVRAFRYRKMRLIKTERDFNRIMAGIIIWRLFYLAYTLLLPLLMLDMAPWLIITGFLLMHFVTGLMLSLVFQSAHVMPECDFPVPDHKGQVDSNFAVHQLSTTTNFATQSRWLSWAIGGLNYQIEHHLFPTISHIHYGKLSKIVAATANEFGIAYHTQKTFLGAILSHGKMLFRLGRTPVQALEAAS
ncbi:MAG: acyl-CoA desaturase [Bacteroidota bacterium]